MISNQSTGPAAVGGCARKWTVAQGRRRGRGWRVRGGVGAWCSSQGAFATPFTFSRGGKPARNVNERVDYDFFGASPTFLSAFFHELPRSGLRALGHAFSSSGTWHLPMALALVLARSFTAGRPVHDRRFSPPQVCALGRGAGAGAGALVSLPPLPSPLQVVQTAADVRLFASSGSFFLILGLVRLLVVLLLVGRRSPGRRRRRGPPRAAARQVSEIHADSARCCPLLSLVHATRDP